MLNRMHVMLASAGILAFAGSAAWLAKNPASKLHICWAVLRGRTVAYRLSITGGGLVIPDGAYGGIIREVTVTGEPSPAAITVNDIPDWVRLTRDELEDLPGWDDFTGGKLDDPS